MRMIRGLALFALLLSAACKQTTLVDIDDGNGGGGGGNGGGSNPPTCPTTIDYAPRGGTISKNGTTQLTVQNWPTNTNCQPFWYVDKPSVAQIAGADNTITIDGTVFYAGIHAVLRGVYQGTVNVCVQTSVRTPETKKCYVWTVTSASSDISFDLATNLRYMNIGGVSQMYTPH